MLVNDTIPEADIVVAPVIAPDNTKLVKVPKLVIFGWDAVNNVPLILFALIVPLTPKPPVITKAPVPVVVDAVALVNVTIPEALNVVAPEIAPAIVKLVRVPKLVIFGWDAVDNVPTNVIADNELIPVILLLESNTKAFEAWAVPAPVVKSK